MPIISLITLDKIFHLVLLVSINILLVHKLPLKSRRMFVYYAVLMMITDYTELVSLNSIGVIYNSIGEQGRAASVLLMEYSAPILSSRQ